MDKQEDKKPESEQESTTSAKRLVGRRAQRQAQTRSHLLRAAHSVFARVGLTEATIAQITEKADVGFGTFYLYFSSKEDIYRALIVEGFAVLNGRIDQLLQDAHTNKLAWKKVLEQVIQTFLRFASEQRELFFMMFSGQEAGIAAGQHAFVPIAVRIAGLLQEAQRELSAQGPLVKPDEAGIGTPDLDSLSLSTIGLFAEIIVTILNRTTRWWLRQQTETISTSQEVLFQDNTIPPSVEEVSALICKFILVGITGLFSSTSDAS